MKQWQKEGKELNFAELYPLLMGQGAGAVDNIESAQDIVEVCELALQTWISSYVSWQGMVTGAVKCMKQAQAHIIAKL